MSKFLAWCCLAVLSAAAPLAAQTVGTVDKLIGQAQYRPPQGETQALKEGQNIQVGASIVTQAGSEVHLDMADGGFLAVRPSTHFTVQQYSAEKGPNARMDLSLLQGALRSISGWISKFNAPGYRIATPTSTVGIRGTDHEVTVLSQAEDEDAAGTYNSVHEGSTVLRNLAGQELELQAEEDGFVDATQAPPRRLDKRPGFFQRRQLKLEARVLERRAAVRQRVLEALKDNPEVVEALRERWQDLTPAQRQAVRERLQERSGKGNANGGGNRSGGGGGRSR